MAKIFSIESNYLIITDSDTSAVEFEAPLSLVRYIRKPNDYINIYSDGDRTALDQDITYPASVFEDDAGSVDPFKYLRNNTGA